MAFPFYSRVWRLEFRDKQRQVIAVVWESCFKERIGDFGVASPQNLSFLARGEAFPSLSARKRVENVLQSLIPLDAEVALGYPCVNPKWGLWQLCWGQWVYSHLEQREGWNVAVFCGIP